MKKLFTQQTLHIANGDMLEEVKERFFELGFPVLWGYEEQDYAEDDKVSSGYLHYEDKMYFLSKKTFDKPIMKYEDFKITIIEPKKPRSKNKKRFNENDLREAMEFGLMYGYRNGFSVGSFGDDGNNFEPPTYDAKQIFGDWFNDTEK